MEPGHDGRAGEARDAAAWSSVFDASAPLIAALGAFKTLAAQLRRVRVLVAASVLAVWLGDGGARLGPTAEQAFSDALRTRLAAANVCSATGDDRVWFAVIGLARACAWDTRVASVLLAPRFWPVGASGAAAVEATRQLLARGGAEQRDALEALADRWEEFSLKTVVTLRDDVVALTADLVARGTLPPSGFHVDGKDARAAAAALKAGACTSRLGVLAGVAPRRPVLPQPRSPQRELQLGSPSGAASPVSAAVDDAGAGDTKELLPPPGAVGAGCTDPRGNATEAQAADKAAGDADALALASPAAASPATAGSPAAGGGESSPPARTTDDAARQAEDDDLAAEEEESDSPENDCAAPVRARGRNAALSARHRNSVATMR